MKLLTKGSLRYLLQLLLIAAIVFVHITIRQNKNSNFGCEICSDKSGYYVYLPALFYYGFHAHKYPDGLDKIHGEGFYLQKDKDIMFTKYTSGLAIMQLPFYATGYVINKAFHLNQDPFSKYYLRFINVGAAFYVALGLFFLCYFLRRYFSLLASFVSVVALFYGTNLFYYVIDESLMSHLYSFFLFSISLFLWKRFLENARFSFFILVSALFSLAVLIRPTNIIFGVFLVFMDVNSWDSFLDRLKNLLKIKYIIAFLVVFFIVFSPQLFYWHFISGKWILYSYGEEGFTYWKSPKFMDVFFSPQSGLFPYTPMFFLIIFSMIWMIFKRASNSILLLLIFILVGYMCSSWNCVQFGDCNFGKRPYVEYISVFSIPMAFYIEKLIQSKARFLKAFLAIIFSLLVLYNIQLTKAFDTCFFGEIWDWNKFKNLLDKGRVLGYSKKDMVYFDDMDNTTSKVYRFNANAIQENSNAFSGKNVSILDSINHQSVGFGAHFFFISNYPVNKVEVSLKIYQEQINSTCLLICSIDSAGIDKYCDSIPVNSNKIGMGKWSNFDHTFTLPTLDLFWYLKIYCKNYGKDATIIDNLRVHTY